MSLPRKDLRTKLKVEIHQGLRLLAELAGVTMERYAETIITKHVACKARDAIMAADEFRRAGIDGSFRDSAFDDGQGAR